MKCLIANVMTTILALGLGAAIAQAQNWSSSVPLGDVARQLKTQRAKSQQKVRLFTNDDLVALPTSGDQPAASRATPWSTTSKERNPEEKPAKPTSANQTGQESASATPAETVEQTHVEGSFRDRTSTPDLRPEGQRSVVKFSPSAVKVVKRSAPPAGHTLVKRVGQQGGPAPTGEWAKARFRAAPRMASGAIVPGPIAAASNNPQPPARQDLGYVETADGQVEAIVAEGEHVLLAKETEAFVRNFHDPAPSLTMAEAAPVSPSAINPPASPSLEAGRTPSTGGEVDSALVRQPEPPAGDNGQSASEGSATLQSEPLADYAGDQFQARPPETLQAPPCPVLPPLAPEGSMNQSTVSPLGYVEKAGGEREAIIEVQDQIYLVHEGELFAEKYRALHVTPSSVEIVEEPTKTLAAAPVRRRDLEVVNPPVSR